MDNVLIDVDTSTIEHLDFVPCCEHSRHQRTDDQGPPVADWYRHSKCPGCGSEATALLCEPCREFLSAPKRPIRDNGDAGCQQVFPSSEWINLWLPIGDAS